MANSLLAHLIPLFAAPEPAATRALTYILNAAPEVASQFTALVGRTGLAAFEHGLISAEERHGAGIPDVTIRDKGGIVRVLVENKFWAGLTPAQPIGYLNQLPTKTPAVLLFVVPRTRMRSVWRELKDRCDAGELTLSKETVTDDMLWARAGRHTMAVTSWKLVLDELAQAASSHGYDGIERDILQVRGLTDQQNADEFLPLAESDLTDGRIPRRLLNYDYLVSDVIRRLQGDGEVDTEGLGVENAPGTYWGRWVRLHSRFTAWIGVDLDAWRTYGITPIWWEIRVEDDEGGTEGTSAEALRELIEEAAPGAPDEGNAGSWVYVPIHLMIGAERDRVIDGMAAQIHSIGERLDQAP